MSPTATARGRTTLETMPWDEVDRRTVDVCRALAMDSVEAAGSGHPGTAMSLAPAAHLLFSRYLRHDPTDPEWPGRDRFVLSCGHSSITLYTQLYLTGYGLTLEDLAHLRQWGSLTPGHPEHGHTPGVETTTGPLGQGVGNAVGMAMAARRQKGLLDRRSDLFDHTVWVFASDGDLQEGVSAEASSLAGTQELGNLVMVWDDNKISIEDDTSIAFNEDVLARYEAYGWHVQSVSFVQEDGSYVEDVEALAAAFDAALAETGRPSFIRLRTIIGWPAPNKQNTGKAHGSALGADEVAATKEILGLDPSKTFDVPDDVLQHARSVVQRGQELRKDWEQRYDAWAEKNADGAELHRRLRERRLPAGWQDALPTFEASDKGIATRKASGEVLNALAPVLPELWGGSADLAESNNTTMEGSPSFLPPEHSSKAFPGELYGRTLHFGIREHAMGAVMNGIALHGG
ncbi:MAG: transketolase, partial [Actinomycetes bacterium]